MGLGMSGMSRAGLVGREEWCWDGLSGGLMHASVVAALYRVIHL